MKPAEFFFIGMFFIWAVLSGKALAIWNAIVGNVSTATASQSQNADNSGAAVQNPNFGTG